VYVVIEDVDGLIVIIVVETIYRWFQFIPCNFRSI
jgi:hypothetical protein